MTKVAKTCAELARILGVSQSVVYRLEKIDGLQRAPDGAFDVAEARQLLKTRQGRKKGDWPGLAPDLKLRRQQADTKLTELKLKKATGELHGNADCVRQIYQVEMRAKRELLTMGRVLSSHLVGKDGQEMASIIDAHITKIMDELSEGYKRIQEGIKIGVTTKN